MGKEFYQKIVELEERKDFLTIENLKGFIERNIIRNTQKRADLILQGKPTSEIDEMLTNLKNNRDFINFTLTNARL